MFTYVYDACLYDSTVKSYEKLEFCLKKNTPLHQKSESNFANSRHERIKDFYK